MSQKIVSDSAIRAQDDFYHHINNHWLKANPRPKSHSSWNHFAKRNQQVTYQIQAILRDWSEPSVKLTPAQKQVVSDYQSLLVRDKFTDNSLKSLKSLVKMIDDLDSTNLPKVLAELARAGCNLFWNNHVGEDDKNNTRHSLYLFQGGLNLPNREYYLLKSKRMKQVRSLYLDFITSLSTRLKRLGLKLELGADFLLELETKLATKSWAHKDVQDPEKTYNPYPLSKFKQTFTFGWDDYFKTLGRDNYDYLIVAQPDYFEFVVKLITELPLNQLKQYLSWQLVVKYSPLLSESLSHHYFQFFAKQLLGQQRQKPLKQRMALIVNGNYKDTVGQEYVKRHFPEDQRADVKDLAAKVQVALAKRIERVDWMAEQSKTYAKKKLKRIIVNIGHSQTWESYQGLKVSADNPLLNQVRRAQLGTKMSLERLDEKPNRHNFGYGPYGAQRVNAWTSPPKLNTNYPAAILAWPFYSKQASLAHNLGAIGAVIGHELTHNFDDDGSKYDVNGQLKRWLKPAEQKRFNQDAEKLIKHASSHKVATDTYMDGEQVIGELIADLGGLETALDVAKENCKKEGLKQTLKDVFIAYTYIHANSSAEELKIMQAKADEHPDWIFRVNGVFAHCDDFYSTYSLKPTDKMFLSKDQRAKIW